MDLLPAVLVESELSLSGPDISAVRSHVHRKVAHHLDTKAVGIFSQVIPLDEEVVLILRQLFYPRAVFSRKLFDHLVRVAELVLIRPLVPRLAPVYLLEDSERDVSGEPVLIVFAELLVSAVVRELVPVDHLRISGKSSVA